MQPPTMQIQTDPVFIVSQGLGAAEPAPAPAADLALERVTTAGEQLTDAPAWQDDDESMDAIDSTPPGIRERPPAQGPAS